MERIRAALTGKRQIQLVYLRSRVLRWDRRRVEREPDVAATAVRGNGRPHPG
jgi:hypothetical protein